MGMWSRIGPHGAPFRKNDVTEDCDLFPTFGPILESESDLARNMVHLRRLKCNLGPINAWNQTRRLLNMRWLSHPFF